MTEIALTAGADPPRNLGLVPLDADKDPRYRLGKFAG
jgi:hypothetical protein